MRQHVWLVLALLISGTLLGAAGCEAQTVNARPAVPAVTETAVATATQGAAATVTATSAVEQLRTEVIATYPHDSTAFTEGLEFDGGWLFESTGEYGASTLRQVDPTTGEVLRRINLPRRFFGEGLALVGDHLVQLTWRENTAFIYDRATFAQLGQFRYTGEGWGLCFDGQWLYLSDGTSTITLLDPQTFIARGLLQVTLDGQPVEMLNELECVGNFIYADVWRTDHIVRIDKATGRVSAVIQASGLLTPEQQQAAGPEGVLNGIAYNPQQDDFFITGKLWPRLFEVRFVPAIP